MDKSSLDILCCSSPWYTGWEGTVDKRVVIRDPLKVRTVCSTVQWGNPGFEGEK